MSIIRNVLAVLLGAIIGSVVNMNLIKLGHKMYPIEGIDPNNWEALAAVMPVLEPKYFIFPFLAHALGTLIGAILASWIAVAHKMKFAFAIGLVFLAGGILASFMIPAPTWFIIIDLLLAYLPMAWIGGKIGSKFGA